ncbi:nucleoside hydrolase [Gilvimarinus sp. DA14]|uniref:nucleoside hydrolase n=1 Tax=Gilvimarinus sp. DA14 TaxID=2956798 RepID=UPI0020B752AC|nr:nucleoside hydrolase [Gilvimarinus sp. DA14]UTF59751.1 nucleoside hydrolase [Gilvimarinus sp. DA14]
MHKLILVMLFLSLPVLAKPIIIFDTDFGADADDMGALAMLNHMHNAERCELLAVMNWNNERHALPAIAAVNAYYGNPEIKLGTRKDGLWEADWQYSKPLVDALGSAGASIDATPSTTDLYRRLLTQAEDHSITIVTVGPLLNILQLLESQPDDISSRSGKELVENKVKEFVIMGGAFPSSEWEWNFNGNMPGVTQKVLETLQVPVVFSGYEVGQAIKTGEALNRLDPKHPLYISYRHFSEHAPWMKDSFDGDISPNPSYDQTAVLYAVAGGLDKWWTLSPAGEVIADDKGGNQWRETAEGLHRYLILTGDNQKLQQVILDAMLGKG